MKVLLTATTTKDKILYVKKALLSFCFSLSPRAELDAYNCMSKSTFLFSYSLRSASSCLPSHQRNLVWRILRFTDKLLSPLEKAALFQGLPFPAPHQAPASGSPMLTYPTPHLLTSPASPLHSATSTLLVQCGLYHSQASCPKIFI